MAERVTAAQKNAEGPRPLCECHGKKMWWSASSSFSAGGYWKCSSPKYAIVSAATKYGEIGGRDNAPLCDCHLQAMRWQARGAYPTGGCWRCVWVEGEGLEKRRRRDLTYRLELTQQRKLLGLCIRCGESSNGLLCELHREKERQRKNRNHRNQSIARTEQQISSLTTELETIATALGIPKEVFLEAVN